jgi:hypothetical protein
VRLRRATGEPVDELDLVSGTATERDRGTRVLRVPRSPILQLPRCTRLRPRPPARKGEFIPEYSKRSGGQQRTAVILEGARSHRGPSTGRALVAETGAALTRERVRMARSWTSSPAGVRSLRVRSDRTERTDRGTHAPPSPFSPCQRVNQPRPVATIVECPCLDTGWRGSWPATRSSSAVPASTT